MTNRCEFSTPEAASEDCSTEVDGGELIATVTETTLPVTGRDTMDYVGYGGSMFLFGVSVLLFATVWTWLLSRKEESND